VQGFSQVFSAEDSIECEPYRNPLADSRMKKCGLGVPVKPHLIRRNYEESTSSAENARVYGDKAGKYGGESGKGTLRLQPTAGSEILRPLGYRHEAFHEAKAAHNSRF
jgi:hypothetical protein